MHPIKAKYVCTMSHVRKIIVATWILAFLLATPILFTQVSWYITSSQNNRIMYYKMNFRISDPTASGYPCEGLLVCEELGRLDAVALPRTVYPRAGAYVAHDGDGVRIFIHLSRSLGSHAAQDGHHRWTSRSYVSY